MEEFRDESNFVTGFIKDHCEYDDKVMITTSDFCAAFAVWWQEEHGENKGVPSNKSIGRAMSALSDPLVAIDHDNLRQAGHRYYAGIRLSDSGLDYWLGAAGDNLAKGKSARMSRTRDKVIKPVPEGWLYKPAIIRMRRAAAGRREP